MQTPTSQSAIATTETAGLQVLIFSVQGEEYAFRLTDTREIIKTPAITHVPGTPEAVSGILNLRGKIVTTIELGTLFKLPVATKEKDPTKKHVIIVESGADTFGLLVDTVTEVMRTADENLKHPSDVLQSHEQGEYISGVIVMPESDRLILMLDLPKILQSFTALPS